MNKLTTLGVSVFAALFGFKVQALDETALEMGMSQPEYDAVQSSILSAREISRRAEEYNGRPYRRDAHAKATGCVRATFTVNPDIPARFKASLFEHEGHQYPAWIRFSNGDMLVQADKKGDARGMAIKVMNVPGDPIAPELGASGNQDFIMTNVPAFFNRNIFDYAEDMLFLAKFERTKWFISIFPPRFHPKQFYRAIQTVSTVIDTPLDAQYFSMLPYQLGKNTIKFSTKPCKGMTFPGKVDRSPENYLNTQLQEQLLTDGACFDFMVQEKVTGKYMPIDDATVIWSEKASPFIPIATIHIPPQLINSPEQTEFCENVSMNPWRAVDGWEPLGSLNRARRLVYKAVSDYRHMMNKVPTPEPTSWCLKEEQTEACKTERLIETTPNWPFKRDFDYLARPLGDEKY
ncbi:putative Catalase [Vibrio nigripulchritudo SOn1]|uniref:catalase n=1 Tax=Vibrio nigripulchritudo SOn1 TaxID=1238450 RepID=A0AAV2VJ52_9VIBR|nr:catalase family protein [Vibrio nigripulchritudo]CCO44523.1 putative Catalase [Vibrio nigripulchritudo SOn1]